MEAALKNPLVIMKVSKVVEESLFTKAELRKTLDVPALLTQNQNIN